MSLEQPWVRDYNYLKDLSYTTFQYYNESYRAYPITYYSLDHENTTWDTEKLRGGSYEKAGVGNLSGVLWKKIYTLPVFGLEQILPEVANEEHGQTYAESLVTNIAFPASYGLRPCEGDVVDLSFMFDSRSPKIKPIYLLTNVNLAHQNVYNQIYQCRVKVAPFDLTELEKQLSTYYLFLNSTHEIVSIDKGMLLLKLEQRFGTLSERLDELFDDSSGFYLRRLE